MHFDQYTNRLMTAEDAHAYYAFIERNRARLEDFFPGTVAATRTLEDTKAHLKDLLAEHVGRTCYPFVLVDETTGALVASVRLKNVDWNLLKAEIGYCVDADCEGRGLVTEAVSKIIAYGFEELGLAKIYIRTHESNIGSRKVAEKNGLTQEGTIRRDHKTTSGEVVDLMYYGILRDEYRGVRRGSLCSQ